MMVVGVFMATFLVGSLWYIMGIGDAIVYRERLQDAADASVYTSAVVHARGMNMIAMLNLIVAAVLAVLVAFKLLQLINWIANAVSCALWWTSVGSAVCSLTTSLEQPIASAVQAAEQLANTDMPVLSKTQVGIAEAMPWVAQAKSGLVVAQKYKDAATAGGMLSPSLVPFIQGRLGLPVQEDDYGFLCGKAGEQAGKLVFSPFGGFGDWVAGVVGNVVQTFPGYFCGDTGAGYSGDARSVVTDGKSEDLVKQGCNEQWSKLSPEDQDDFDWDECIKRGEKGLENGVKSLAGKGGEPGISSNGKTSKRIFDDAQNGDGYFQTWSIVIGDDEWPKKTSQGVKIAAWNKKTPLPEVPWGKVILAQAEFYCDVPGRWEDVKEDAIWNMRWRARMRRVHLPEGPVTEILGQLKGSLGGKLGGVVAAALDDPTVSAFVFGTGSQEDLIKQVRALTQGGSAWSGTAIEDAMLGESGGIELIH